MSSPLSAGAEAENGFHGQLEEIYLKNCSTESRQVYIYTDNVRPTSGGNVRVFDLSHAAGRTYYATIMSSILNAADFDTTQVRAPASAFVLTPLNCRGVAVGRL